MPYTKVEVSTTSYTVTGLQPETAYTIRALFIQNGNNVRQDKASPPFRAQTLAAP